MAILNWRDHPRLRFVDFPPAAVNKGAVFIAADRNDSAWISDGTAYYPLYGSGLEAPHLGRKTWAELPNPLTVPEGTGATLYGWTAPEAEWVTWSGYWVPKGGRAVVHAPILVGAQAQHTSLAPVASVPTWTMPLAMLQTPRLSLYGRAQGVVSNPASTQARQLFIGYDGPSVGHKSFIAGLAATGTSQVVRAIGTSLRDGSPDGAFLCTGWNSTSITSNAAAPLSIPVADLVDNPIRLSYQGGSTDGSEILSIHHFSIAVELG